MNLYKYMESPIGPLKLIGNGRSLTNLYMNAHKYERDQSEDWVLAEDDPVLNEAERQLTEYFAGKRTEFDLPLESEGTSFQRRCWLQLQEIPFGETWSYGKMAKLLEAPDSSRAVGAANGKNPISIIVPCHRVIGANGKLVGFGGGLPRKASLLNFERAIAFGESADEYWENNPCELASLA